MRLIRSCIVVGLGPGGAQFLTAQAQSALEASRGAVRLSGLSWTLCAPYYPEKEYYATGMTKETGPLPLGAGNCPGSGRTVALVCSGDAGVYGMASPLLELAEELPGRDRGGGARPDCRPQRRRGAGCPAGPRFLRASLFRTGSPRGRSSKSGWPAAAMGDFCTGAVQSFFQGPPGLSAPGRAHPAGKTARPRTPSAGWCATLAGKGQEALRC